MSIMLHQPKMSLLIKNGKIYANNSLIKKNVFIENGVIAKVTEQNLKADKIIDAISKIVIPGLIDEHVHFREPGHTYKEDFLSGSMAAAAGGITSIQDMPNTEPPVINLQRLDEKRKLAKKSIVNYGLHFGSTIDNVNEIKKANNIASVKVFMDHTTGELLIEDDAALEEIFKTAKRITVHAEGANVLKARKLIENTGNALHFMHLSSKQELHDAKHNVKSERIFAEVCPHHLFLSQDDLDHLSGFGIMKPSLKNEADVKALWEGIKTGLVDTIGTDHAPHTREEKLDPNVPYGVPGCETMLPLLLNAMHQKKITLNKIIQLCSENPAKIFGLKKKGHLRQGFDADITVIDPVLEREVVGNKMFSKCKWTPFEGRVLKGWPVATVVNGNVVFENGNINKVPAKELTYYE